MKKLLALVTLCLVVGCGTTSGGTGGGSGGGAGGGAGGGTGGGSGGGAGGGGGGAPVEITVNYTASCTPLTACGGAVVGTWQYSAGCVELGSLFPAAHQVCNTIAFSNVTGKTHGSLAFTATNVTRDTTANLAGTATVPPPCNTAGCPAVQAALATTFKTVACSVSGADCSCAFTADIVTAGTSPYTITGNSLTTNPGTSTATTYDYCVAGTTLTYRELGSSPKDPGIFVMDKK